MRRGAAYPEPMRIDRGLLGWGIVFILLGAVPLAVQAGLVDRDLAVQAWRLWPLLLVGAGIGLIVREGPLAVAGGLVVAATVGLMGGGLLAGGSVDIGSIACGGGSSGGQAFDRGGTLGDRASVSLEFRCGDLTVNTAEGSGWTSHVLTDADRPPAIEAASDRLSISSGGNSTFFLPGFGSGPEHWTIALPRTPQVDLDVTMNAGKGTLNLGGGRFGSIDSTVNAGSVRVDLSEATLQDIGITLNAGDLRLVLPAASFQGSWTVNAGSVRFCVPSSVGLRLQTNDNITASFDYGRSGLTRDGSTWTSPNFATAQTKIELTTTANAGSFSLNPADGCR